jgi:hypothetical protein
VRKLLDHLLEAIPALGGGEVSRPVTQIDTRPVSNPAGAVRREAAVAGLGQRA